MLSLPINTMLNKSLARGETLFRKLQGFLGRFKHFLGKTDYLGKAI